MHSTVSSSDNVEVSRGNGRFEMIPSDELVPGDVISIPSYGCELHCDAVLVSGNAIGEIFDDSIPGQDPMISRVFS